MIPSTPIERLHKHAKTRFSARDNNCAHAALAAFAGSDKCKAAWFFANDKALRRQKANILQRAEHGAAQAGLSNASATGPAWGVCSDAGGYAICVRYTTIWWRTTPRGIARQPDATVLCAWAAY